MYGSASDDDELCVGHELHAGPAANDFVHRCAALHRGRRVAALCAQLRRALHHADARRGGWVLYATHSLNPMENEAVVCATLTVWQQQQQQQRKKKNRRGGGWFVCR